MESVGLFLAIICTLSVVVFCFFGFMLERQGREDFGFGSVPKPPPETREQRLARQLRESEDRALEARVAQYRAEHALWDQQFKAAHKEYPNVTVKYPHPNIVPGDYATYTPPDDPRWGASGPGPKWYDEISKSWTTARNDQDLAEQRAEMDRLAKLNAQMRDEVERLSDEIKVLEGWSVIPKKQLSRVDRLLDRWLDEEPRHEWVTVRTIYPDPPPKPKKTKPNGDPILSNKQPR